MYCQALTYTPIGYIIDVYQAVQEIRDNEDNTNRIASRGWRVQDSIVQSR
jgi:hypothetical protein